MASGSTLMPHIELHVLTLSDEHPGRRRVPPPRGCAERDVSNRQDWCSHTHDFRVELAGRRDDELGMKATPDRLDSWLERRPHQAPNILDTECRDVAAWLVGASKSQPDQSVLYRHTAGGKYASDGCPREHPWRDTSPQRRRRAASDASVTRHDDRECV